MTLPISFPHLHTIVQSLQSNHTLQYGLPFVIGLLLATILLWYYRNRQLLHAYLPPIKIRVHTTPILVVALIFSAYYIGSLRTELQFRTAQQVFTAQAATVAASPTPQPAASVPPLTDADHIRGDKNAKVVLVEYSDLECPFCKEFHPAMQQIMADYGSNIAWVYRHFPLPFHQNAEKEAEAAECVNEQGGNSAFWQFVDTIYQRTTSNGTGFALEKLGPLAAELGLDQTAFQNCLDSGKYAPLVAQETDSGQAASVNGTPTTFIIPKKGNIRIIPGALPYAQLKPLIDKAMQ